ncbi:MAG: DNA repair exonuclease [Candidatus Marinimicrobia bacterium]|nr:DNA repair exonuclease [Candidatus Neomarinimicrobiota bacterium]
MFKFIHAADIHLDSPMHRLFNYEGAPVEEIRLATRRVFENLINMAIDEKVKFIVIAGDLYDGDWKDYNTGLFFISQMNKLKESGIFTFIVEGNHDAANTITKALRLPDKVVKFKTKEPQTHTMNEIEVAIHGQSYSTPAVTNDLSLSYPPPIPGFFNLGLLHTCATGREGHENYAPCTIDGLVSRGYDYWALGHVHKREVLKNSPLIQFSGNLQGRHIRESGAKGCFLITVDEHGKPHSEFKPLDVVRWFEVESDTSDISSPFDLIDDTMEKINKLLIENEKVVLVIRITLNRYSKALEKIASDMEKWSNEFRAAAINIGNNRVWIEKIKIQAEHKPADKKIFNSGSPIAELLDYINEIQDDPKILSVIENEFTDLRRKLPSELTEGSEVINFSNKDWISGILNQVGPMLLNRSFNQEK